MLRFYKFLILFVCTSTFGQLNKAYFQKIQNQKIISSNKLEWVQFGPGMSGYCEFFWPHPTDSNTIHMSPDMFNAYGTFDGGASWQCIKDYDGLGRDMGRTYDIEFSRKTPNLGFAIDELGGLFKTNNKGRSWSKHSFDLIGAHSEIAVDPTDDNNWYIGAGSWWDVKRTHRTVNNSVTEKRKKAVRGHIYRTENGGANWIKVPANENERTASGLPITLDVIRIIVNPLNPQQLIMAANTGMYKSTNKGKNWNLITNFNYPGTNDKILPKDMTSTYIDGKLTLFLVAQTRYFANRNTYISDGGIFKSTDAGNTWSSITGDLGLDLTAINIKTSYYFKRTISKWFGIPTSKLGKKLPSNILQNFNRIVVNPKNQNEIYISHNIKHDFSFGPGDVWKTTNGGLNWYPCTLTGKYWEKDKNYWTKIKKMPIALFKRNTSFAHLQHEMDIREEIWGCRFLAINSDGDVFISLDQQILKSTDGGKNWKQIDDNETKPESKSWINKGDSNLPGRYIYLDTGIPNRQFFLSGEHGLWKSTDLGNFTGTNKVAVTQIEGQVNPGGAHSISTLAIHPKNPDIIYTLQFRQAHRNYFRSSINGGKTWTNIGKPFHYSEKNLSGEHIYSSSLMIEPENANNIYFTAMRYSPSEINEGEKHTFDEYGVYKSTDGGENWSLKNNGFPFKASIRRIAMHPNKSNILYAASNFYKGVKGGLYKTINRANSWSKVTIPKNISSVNNVHINKATNTIYISCGTNSGKSKKGGVYKSHDNGTTWQKIFDAPYVWQTETSTLDSNIIIVTVPLHKTHKNPGAYVTFDGGANWTKINKNLAHAHFITDIKPDITDKNVFWSAGWGSGWYKGTWKDNTYNKSQKK